MGSISVHKNLIITLLSIEFMLLAINLLLVASSVNNDDLMGQIYTLLILTVAAAESAIGLAILVAYYKLKGAVNIDFITQLKG